MTGGHRARIASNPLTRKIPEELRRPSATQPCPGCLWKAPASPGHSLFLFFCCLLISWRLPRGSLQKPGQCPKANVTASQSHHTTCLLPSCHISGNEPQAQARLAEYKAPVLSRSSGVSVSLPWRELSNFPLGHSWRKGHIDTKRSR